MVTTQETHLPADADVAGQVYRAFWRWHFYAAFRSCFPTLHPDPAPGRNLNPKEFTHDL